MALTRAVLQLGRSRSGLQHWKPRVKSPVIGCRADGDRVGSVADCGTDLTACGRPLTSKQVGARRRSWTGIHRSPFSSTVSSLLIHVSPLQSLSTVVDPRQSQLILLRCHHRPRSLRFFQHDIDRTERDDICSRHALSCI